MKKFFAALALAGAVFSPTQSSAYQTGYNYLETYSPSYSVSVVYLADYNYSYYTGEGAGYTYPGVATYGNVYCYSYDYYYDYYDFTYFYG